MQRIISSSEVLIRKKKNNMLKIESFYVTLMSKPKELGFYFVFLSLVLIFEIDEKYK